MPGTTLRNAGDSRDAAFVHCIQRWIGLDRPARRKPTPRQRPSRAARRSTVAGDCASCHTADPAKPFAGGKRIDTPFGAIYSPNLTPDRDTGLGGWSDEDFCPRPALRRGAGRLALLPGIPLSRISRNSPATICWRSAPISRRWPPSATRRPPPELRWPLNYRVVMRLWDYLFFRPGIFEPDQQKSAEWNRGGYLVTGVAHCGACHTPKNIFGADKRGAGLWRRTGRWLVRATPRQRRAQRAEIVERRGHRRISAERPQRQKPCRRADGGGRGQFDLEDERRRYPRDRRLSEGSARRRAGTCRRPRRRRRR